MMPPWKWIRYRWYVWTGRVHPAARIDSNKRVYAVNETAHADDTSYWTWVKREMPHALSLTDQEHEDFQEVYHWLAENTTTLWSMRASMFRAMNSGRFLSLPLKNVYYFANEDDAFAFRIRFGARLGEELDEMVKAS